MYNIQYIYCDVARIRVWGYRFGIVVRINDLPLISTGSLVEDFLTFIHTWAYIDNQKYIHIIYVLYTDIHTYVGVQNINYELK